MFEIFSVIMEAISGFILGYMEKKKITTLKMSIYTGGTFFLGYFLFDFISSGTPSIKKIGFLFLISMIISIIMFLFIFIGRKMESKKE
jgi:hypothetical protein